jgi:hypothetical protein
MPFSCQVIFLGSVYNLYRNQGHWNLLLKQTPTVVNDKERWKDWNNRAVFYKSIIFDCL